MAKTPTTWKPGVNNGGAVGNRGNANPPNQFGAGNPGRPKGCKNRTDIGKAYMAESHASDELKPLEFFMRMANGKPFKVRKINPADGKAIEVEYLPTFEDMKWGAAMAAPYMHPKLANIQHTGDVTVTHESFLDQLAQEDGGDTIRH